MSRIEFGYIYPDFRHGRRNVSGYKIPGHRIGTHTHGTDRIILQTIIIHQKFQSGKDIFGLFCRRNLMTLDQLVPFVDFKGHSIESAVSGIRPVQH